MSTTNNTPIVVSFSGGRSSGMMASIMADRPEAIFLFCNTGKEAPETLNFVSDCASHWGVDIVWVEYRPNKTFEIVTHETASRNGEPFEYLIEDRKYLPNMVARFCTSELKVLTIERYLKSIGVMDYETAVGIRADEPRRVAKMRAKQNYLTPLADLKVTKNDVLDFWRKQKFNLKLPESGFYSNCDLCFLKGGGIKQSIIREKPEKADWWISMEEKIGAKFRADQPDYKSMKIIASTQQSLDFFDPSVECFCGD